MHDPCNGCGRPTGSSFSGALLRLLDRTFYMIWSGVLNDGGLHPSCSFGRDLYVISWYKAIFTIEPG